MSGRSQGWVAGVAMPAAVFLFAVGIAWAVAFALRAAGEAQARTDFTNSAERVAEEISRRYGRVAFGLTGIRAVYAASGRVQRAEFRDYVGSLYPHLFRGTTGFGFAERVARGDVDAFVAAARADGAPGFALRESADGNPGDLFVVKYIEPAPTDFAMEGADLGADALQRAAIERATTSGEPAMSGATTHGDARTAGGPVLYVPIYAKGSKPANAAERRAALVGLAFAPIALDELLAGAEGTTRLRVHFEVFDRADGSLHASPPIHDSAVHGNEHDHDPASDERFAWTRPLPLAGRTYTLRATSTPQFDAAAADSRPTVVLACGALIAALFALLLRQQVTGRRRAIALARDLTADLKRLAQVAKHTSNLVAIVDRELAITWINEGFTRIAGYTLDEAAGRTPVELLRSENTDRAALRAMTEASVEGAACRVEILTRAKSGREFWVDFEMQPIHDADGAFQGYMGIGTDITERHESRSRLEAALRDADTLLRTVHMHAIVSETDASGRITKVNGAFSRITGYTEEELVGKDHRIINAGVHPPGFWREMWRTIAAGKPWHGEVCDRGRDGSIFWFDTFIAPFAGEGGRIERYVAIRTDITASKNAEAKLRESEAFKLAILDSVSAEIAVLDRNGIVVSVNEPWRRFVEKTGCEGVDCAPRAGVGTDYLGVCHARTGGGDDVRAIPAPEGIRAVLDGARPSYALEYPCHSLTEERWFSMSVTPLESEAGGVVVAHTDITAQRQGELALRALEAELRRNNELLASVLENLPCGLSVFAPDRSLVVANAAFRQVLDLPDAMFEGTPPLLDDIVRYNAARGMLPDGTPRPADVEAVVRATLDSVRPPVAPHQFELAVGGSRHLEVRRGPMPDGGSVTTYVDISARRRAEADVQRGAELLRAAIAVIDEAFALYDADDRLVFCNDKYREAYSDSTDLIVPGVTFEAIVRDGAQRGHYPDAVGRVDEWLEQRLAIHRDPAVPLIQRLADGRVMRVIERRMSDGHTVGFRVDITELVRATEAAQEARAVAEAATLAKGQFLANMSHEIRTPMSAILGMLALLRNTALTPQQADYAGKTEGAARSLLGLLDDILDFSKVEAGKMTLDPHPFAVQSMLQDLAVILAASARGKPVEVLFDVDPELPGRLVGDAMRLKQVLINLGGNAVKFTAQGEVVVALALVARSATAVTMEVAVRDTGIGIAPENVERIFAGFTQAEASTTRRFGGSGLGLAISQRLVTLMGGRLAVDSTPGAGSRFHFRITLPLAPVPADAALPLQPDSTSGDAATPIRVLLIDDNPTARELLARMARSLGWAVDAAGGGEEGLALVDAQAAQGRAFDAVFVDWQMPGVDGWETVRRLRSSCPPGVTPLIVMVTAHGFERLTERAEDEQALLDGYLVKPVTASMLRGALVDARRGRGATGASRVAPPRLSRRLDGMRVLVAEDNANNQQVARELLEAEGAIVTVASHGLEAVEAVAAAVPPFDAVLMDLQMPVMDGFTATQRIRRDLGRQALPIIAMTANVLAADREACLAAGMSDHIGKPFDLQQLVSLLRLHAERGEAAAEAAPSAPALAPPVLAAAAAAGIELPAAVDRLGGNADLYRRMLDVFVTDLAALGATLAECVNRGDLDAARRLLHTLKGQAATLGAGALAQAAAQGEKEAAAGLTKMREADTVERVSAAIGAASPGICALLRALCAGPPAAAGAPRPLAVDPTHFAAALRTMTLQLRASDMAATDAMIALRGQFGGALGERLEPLDRAIAALDFDRALTLCGELLHEPMHAAAE